MNRLYSHVLQTPASGRRVYRIGISADVAGWRKTCLTCVTIWANCVEI
jgi:hypothetical protein